MRTYKAHIIDTPSPDAFRILENGYVSVSDEGRVVYIGSQCPVETGELIDLGDRLLIPAFCDLHLHAPQYRNNGLAMDLELLPWLNKYTFPEEMKFADVDYARRIYSRFVHELWMQGTMRVSVFATVHPEATRLLADLLREAGLGAYVGLVAMDRNAPDGLRNTALQAFAETTNLDRYLGRDGLVRAIVTPRFIPSCSEEMLTALGRLANESGLPVQSHLSENMHEIDWVHQLEPDATCYGDAYHKYGLFGQTPTLMAHCCYTNPQETQLMRLNNVCIVHCPTSNTNLASGMAPIRHFLNNGIKVALGTDISGGHYMSMLRVIQYAIQTSKIHYAQSQGKMPFLSLAEAFFLATKSGGSFFGKVGCFDLGYDFDALVIDDAYLNFDHYTLPERIERFIYIGDDRDICVRFCRGKQLPEPPQVA
ncbi:MAG: amidohydrolase family protein [Paludibacteraceae bacterium]|nr:amidohydrolase family protein [Paludibacteraceae bacterium]